MNSDMPDQVWAAMKDRVDDIIRIADTGPITGEDHLLCRTVCAAVAGKIMIDDAEPKTFILYEAQEETRVKLWRYTVQAETLEEAIEKAKCGAGADPVDAGYLGDETYEDGSGWGPTPDEAYRDMIENVGA